MSEEEDLWGKWLLSVFEAKEISVWVKGEMQWDSVHSPVVWGYQVETWFNIENLAGKIWYNIQ